MSTRVPAEFKKEMAKFENELNAIPLENKLAHNKRVLTPGTGGNLRNVCGKISTSHSDGTTSTAKVCDIYYSYYYGSNESSTDAIAKTDRLMISSGWQKIVAPTTAGGDSTALAYSKSGITITLRPVSGKELPDTDNNCPGSYATCIDLRKIKGPKYSSYIVLNSELKETF